MKVEEQRSTNERAVREAPCADRWAGALEEFFQRRGEALAPFLALYDESIHFEDPAHCVDGLPAFAEMNRRFAARARVLHIEVTDVADRGGAFLAAWTMRYAPRFGPRMTLAGATLARVRDGRIIHQRDHFDPVGGLARAIPGLSLLYRFIIRSAA